MLFYYIMNSDNSMEQKIKNFTQLHFIIGKSIVGDDIKGIILLLFQKFLQITPENFNCNLELSHSYAINKTIMKNAHIRECINCEIVLKYVHCHACICNNTPHKEAKINNNLKRGIVNFFVKQDIDNTFIYTKIHIVRINNINNLKPGQLTYNNNNMANKINLCSDIASNIEHSDQIFSLANSGNLKMNTTKNALQSIKQINDIISHINTVMKKPQEMMLIEHVTTDTPSQEAIKLANIIRKEYKNNKLYIVPNFPLQINNNMTGGNNTPITTPSLPVDLTIVTDKLKSNVSDITKNISNNAIKLSTDTINKIESSISDTSKKALETITDKTNNALDNLKDKFVTIFGKKVSLVPVSKNIDAVVDASKI